MGLEQLDIQLRNAGLKFLGLTQSSIQEGTEWVQSNIGWIKVCWGSEPSSTDVNTSRNIIIQYQETVDISDKMEMVLLPKPQLIHLAILLRNSFKWNDGSLTANQKTKIQDVIDDAAAKVVTQITS